MSKTKKSFKWRRVFPEKYKRFKLTAIKRGQKVYEAQEEAVDMYLSKHEKPNS